MATKHNVKDTDLYFVIDPSTRNIIKQYTGKPYLMQYDHNSESLTFEVPRYIEEHDMSLCDTIQIHYENSSSGTSASLRQTYRGIEVVKQENVTVNDDVITFSWLIPETATTFAGSLKFQLKFICHDEEFEDVILYKWHTNVNSDISIIAGLAYSENDLPNSVKATLQSLEVWETEKGLEISLDGAIYHVYHGGYTEEALDTVELKANKTFVIDTNSTDEEYPSAKAVLDLFGAMLDNGVSVIRTVNGSLLKIFVGTKAEYEALEDKENLFAIISDDTTKQEIDAAIAENKAGIEANASAIEEHAKHEYPLAYSYEKAEGESFTIDLNELTDRTVYLVEFVYTTVTQYNYVHVLSGTCVYRSITRASETNQISFGKGYFEFNGTGTSSIKVMKDSINVGFSSGTAVLFESLSNAGTLNFYKIGVI